MLFQEYQGRRGLCRIAGYLALAALILALDIGSKAYVAGHFTWGESLRVMPCFNLTYVTNTGAAFSFLGDAGGWQIALFSALALVISVGILVWMWRHFERTGFCIGLSLVLAGALGNAYDRITQGAVVDFLDFYVGRWHWPAFNVADIAICLGAFLVITLEWTSSTNR